MDQKCSARHKAGVTGIDKHRHAPTRCAPFSLIRLCTASMPGKGGAPHLPVFRQVWATGIRGGRIHDRVRKAARRDLEGA